MKTIELKESSKNHHANFITLKNLRERLEIHHSDFITLKNLKGGIVK